jgi:chromosome segregation ATPase
MTASGGEWPTRGVAELSRASDVAIAEREADEEALAAAAEAMADTAAAVAEVTEVVEPEPTRQEFEDLLTQLAEASNAAMSSSAQLDALKSELASVRAELTEARRQLERFGRESESVQGELRTAHAAREAALRSAALAEAERESALTRAAQAEAERDSLAEEHASVAAALQGAQAELDRLTREREQVMASRGAALVMRGATQALPAYEHHVGWVRRGLALLLLIGAVFAALIVLHVL